MLTRLKVKGFKNLVDVDVSFGPFTCIAGVNGAGKSNLFDAIKFLSNLAEYPLIHAARSVRDEEGRTTDIKSLFYQAGDFSQDRMSFEAEMIVPSEGVDDLGQPAIAGITFLRYSLTLKFNKNQEPGTGSPLEICHESLDHIKISEASKHLKFPNSYGNWRKKVIHGRRSAPYISTIDQEGSAIIKLHQEGAGIPKSYPAKTLPRTVLSGANSSEHATALLTKREMQSWRIQQLEPSALREPDRFDDPIKPSTDGKHIAANLHHLARTHKNHENTNLPDSWIYDQAASRLSELIHDVYSIRVDRDETRELLTLLVKDRYGTELPGRSLSDGTLRFLALTVIELDPDAGGVICLEEPENGIHPERIPAIIRLLQDIAVDPTEHADEDNPLRQVIVNTHSPAVVAQVPDASLIVADLKEHVINEKKIKGASFQWLSGTWRCELYPAVHAIPPGMALAFLNPIRTENEEEEERLEGSSKTKKSRRVIDRKELAPYLPFMEDSDG